MSIKLHDYSQLSRPQEIASYYGFRPVEKIDISRSDKQNARPIKNCHNRREKTLIERFADQKISLLRHHVEKEFNSFPRPIMLSYRTTPARSNIEEIHLDIIGTRHSVSEALIIRTALSILKEEGYTTPSVHLNSFGDKESFATFERELIQYTKKHLGEMSARCRESFTNDPFNLFVCDCPICTELREDAPKSINFLDEESRTHLKEVLEYIDTFDTPYEIDEDLFENRYLNPQILFEIHSASGNDKSNVLACGIRYSTFLKTMGYRRDIPAIGIILNYKSRGRRRTAKKDIDRLQNRKFYFVHLGYEAKVKSFHVIENLRRAHIPVHHALTKDKCAVQMSYVHKFNPDYLIIMGIKEALENTVIIRNTETRSQYVVPINNLASFLKRVTLSCRP